MAQASRSFRRLGVALAGLGLLAGFWAWSGQLRSSLTTDASSPSVAVLPLRNLSEFPEESDYLADGITQAVITRLTQVGVRTTPWETARRFRDSPDTTDEIARALNVETVVVGTFQLRDARLLTTLSLVDAASGLQSWTDAFEEDYEDLFAVQRRIAAGVAAGLKPELTGDEELVLAADESTDLDAYDAYLQGAHLLQAGDQESTDVALQYFSRAVELDPNLVEAHVGIGAVHSARYYNGWGGGVRNLDLAEAAYDTALRLDPASMRARRGLQIVYWERGSSESILLQGQEAVRLGQPDDVEMLVARGIAFGMAGLRDRGLSILRQAIELDPLNQAAHFYSTVYATEAGEYEEGVRIGTLSLERFGDDPAVHTQIGLCHQMLGHVERALDHYDRAIRTIDAAPRSALFHVVRSLLYEGALLAHTGSRDLATAAWKRGLELTTEQLRVDPENVRMRLYRAALHGLLGDRRAMMADESRVLAGSDLNALELTYLAAVHARLGEPRRAVAVLQRQLQAGRLAPWRLYLPILAPELLESPELDRFREDFEALERRLRARYR